MRKLTGLLLVAFYCLVSCKSDFDEVVEVALDSNWEFKETKDSMWSEAVVPGNIFSDLKRLNKIPDPFVKQNEMDVQWVSEKEWEYKTSFQVHDSILNKKHIVLSFDGIDTYANIYLNDTLIKATNNAFRSWEIPVKRSLKKQNT